MDFKNIKNEAKKALVDNRLMYFLIIFFVVLVSITIVGIFFVPALIMGYYLIGLDLLDGKKFNANRMLDPFKDLNHILKLFGVGLLYFLIVSIGLVLFIVPGVILALQYSQALFIMSDNPELKIWDAMKKSQELMRGYKLNLFVFVLSFIGHIALSFITFGLYVIYFEPYFRLSLINYHNHLKAHHNPPENAIGYNLE